MQFFASVAGAARPRIVLALAFALVACNQGEKGKAKGEAVKKPAKAAKAAPQKAKLPPKPKTAKQPASQPTSMPAKAQPASMPAGHPPTGKGQPASQPSSQPTSAPTGLPGAVSGTIELDPGLIDSVKKGSSLYIMVRRAGERMPLAAKRIPVLDAKMFPFKYIVTPADVMMKGTVLTGDVTVDARLDQDGDAISKQPGDVTGKTEKAVKVGDKTGNFTLNKKI